jgi:hypothetical protein
MSRSRSRTVSALGCVVIGGHRFGIDQIELRGGEVQIIFTIPPGKAFGGPITVFGTDGKGCWQGKTVNFPDRGEDTVVFRYGMKYAAVLSGDETVDVRDLPGW